VLPVTDMKHRLLGMMVVVEDPSGKWHPAQVKYLIALSLRNTIDGTYRCIRADEVRLA
jgi:hypothetical protein